jgi:hypothetical protein
MEQERNNLTQICCKDYILNWRDNTFHVVMHSLHDVHEINTHKADYVSVHMIQL